MSCTGSLSAPLHLSKRAASIHPLSEKGTLSQKSLTCAKRMNKATYLSLKSDFVKRVWTGIQSFACLGFLERERCKFQRVLRDFVV
ncbi:hypothetical protein HKD37_11G032100 [Glycine soja]